MTFAFFYPLAWLGTLVVGVPIWLHLRQKFQSNVIQFTALRFLDDQPLVRRSPLRLRDLLLFALRVLGVFLLVAAFAWPYWQEAAEPVATESRVYVLDNTLSHQAFQGVEKARDRILAEISDLGSETQVAVIELTDQPRLLVGFGDSRESARQRLLALTPSAQRGSYLAAFRQANSALANSLGRDKQIMFYGDSQQNQWVENLNPPPFLQDIEVTIAEPPAEHAPNLWLSEPRWERMHLVDKTVVDFTFELHHQGDIKSAKLSLSANAEEILSREMDLTDEPETMTLAGRWDVDPAQWVRGEVAVTGTPDVLDADNRVFFSIPPVREGTVLLLTQSPFLRTALSPDVMRGRWSARWMEPSELADSATTAPKDADVLVVESSYLQADKVRDLVLGYLNGGRGVLLLCNRVTPMSNGFLRELGFEPQQADSSGPSPTSFHYVFGEHPIFQPFMAPDFGNLLEVDVYRYQRLRAARAMPLVFSKTGDALFFQGTSTRGRLFVSAFGFDRSETNWPLHPTFVPFLDLCLRNAQAEDTVPTTFEPGEMCVLDLGDANVREVVLRSGDAELARVAVVNGRAQFPVPGSPGSYEVLYDGDQAVQRMLSVNPSPLESKLIYVDATEAVKIWRVNAAESKPAAHSGVTTMALSRLSIMQQRFWWWLLVGGLGALVAETVWLASRKERV